jgi:hypothetical protein
MEINSEQALVELVAQCVDFVPVKAYRKTWTNNHKHIVEKRRAGVDVDNPVQVYWTAEWTICGLSDEDFAKSVGGGGACIVWQVDSKTKKGVADEFHQRIVLVYAELIWDLIDSVRGYNEDQFLLIVKALTEFASKKEGK